MKARRPKRVALTIAGSDSGGGAGIQADLKTFAALGVHGASVITCLTAQNPERVLGIEPASSRILKLQLEAVFAGLQVAAIKTGMLFSAEIIHTVAHILREQPPRPLVVDPVMVSTSGKGLLQPSAECVLRRELLPLATLLTPNLDEAGVLAGGTVRTLEQMRAAARALRAEFGCAILVKGGHLRGGKEAADIFFDGRTELLLTTPYIRGVKTHGTGCTYSAAIAAGLARGLSLPEALRRGKEYVAKLILATSSRG